MYIIVAILKHLGIVFEGTGCFVELDHVEDLGEKILL
jgi:hypothetical protein